MTAEELFERLNGEPVERARWKVLRCFGILPGSRLAGELSDEQAVLCAAHMVLDLRGERDNSEEAGLNSAFDEGVFKQLSEVRGNG